MEGSAEDLGSGVSLRESERLLAALFAIQCNSGSPLVQLKADAVRMCHVQLLINLMTKTTGALERFSVDNFKESLPQGAQLNEFRSLASQIQMAFRFGVEPLYISAAIEPRFSKLVTDARNSVDTFAARATSITIETIDRWERRETSGRDLKEWLRFAFGYHTRRDATVQGALDQMRAHAETVREDLLKLVEQANILKAWLIDRLVKCETACNTHGRLVGEQAELVLRDIESLRETDHA